MQKDPLYAGLRVLCPKQKIETREWEAILQARVEVFKPHLERFTLQPIGKYQCLRGYKRTLEEAVPQKNVCGFSLLKTNGIWGPREDRVPGPDPGPDKERRRFRFWGITRDAEWVIVWVDFTRFYADSQDHADAVLIEAADTAKIVSLFDPKDVFRELGDVARNWKERAEGLLECAKKLELLVRVEATIIGLREPSWIDQLTT